MHKYILVHIFYNAAQYVIIPWLLYIPAGRIPRDLDTFNSSSEAEILVLQNLGESSTLHSSCHIALSLRGRTLSSTDPWV